jgi:maleylacetoacetate isomerase
MPHMLRLYSYFRSSAAYRVRIALNLKGLDYTIVPIHLLREGGQHHTSDYTHRNPAELVPTLEHDSQAITQSLAILEYLEETYPTPALLPPSPLGRARVRALCLTVACEVHPLNNLRVLNFLKDEMGASEDARNTWYRHWVTLGLSAFERLLIRDGSAGSFCYGDAPTFADCYLIPQIFNAKRFQCPLDDYPTLMRIYTNCEQVESFRRAAPASQIDAE